MTVKAKDRSSVTPPDKARTLNDNGMIPERYATGVYLGIAFIVPFALMFFAFMMMGVSPFGNNQILVTDLWHQYYPFLVDYQDKLTHGGSLLWTWKSGGGTNYLALMAYYLASPLNFFSVLVPAEHLREFLYVITCVKIGLAGMFFSLFLRITFKRRDISIAAFGIMYALCAFIMGYYWNIIWLDTVALMPLVIAGAISLLREGKFRLYIAALALSMLSNYYIGVFTCIFVFLVSIGYSIIEFKGLKKTLRDFFKMLGCSIVSIMISAVLLLPAYFALGHTHSSENVFPQNFAINIGSTADFGGLLEGVGKTISNSIAFLSPTAKEGLPNIYCGVFTIFLAILFFFCSKIKKRERIFCGGLLIFFLLSFVIRQLDFIWHGFHFPNMLPYRFSFLYSFVLIYMAFRVFMNIDHIKLVSVIGAICGFIVYMGVVATYYNNADAKVSGLFAPESTGSATADPILLSSFLGAIIAAWILIYTLRNYYSHKITAALSAIIGLATLVFVVVFAPVFVAPLKQADAEQSAAIFRVIAIIAFTIVICAIFFALYMSKFNSKNEMLKPILGVILFLLALTEGMFSAAAGVNSVGVTDGSYYPLGTEDTLAMSAKVRELEEGNIDLPHTEVNKYYTLNDNALIGADGISMFNSMVNKDITDYMQKFGLCGWIASNRYTYQENSPFTNLMLNLKYLIAPYGAYLDTTHNELVATSGNVKLMRNKYYLPMGFMVSDDLLNYDVSAANATDPMANQNDFFRLATGLDGDLYELLDASATDGGSAGSITGGYQGTFTYSSSETSGNYNISYTVPYDGVAVSYFDTYYSDDVRISVNGSEVIAYYVKCPFIMMVGDVKAGDTITCSCSISNSSSGSITCRTAMVNEELFRQAYQMFSRSTLKASVVTDTQISGNINAVEDGLFYTSISYTPGWKAYVDGQEVEITPVGNAMLAFKLSAGPHIIDIKYTPEGFKVGLITSIAGLLIFIAMIILSWRKINLLDMLLARIPSKKSKASADDSAILSDGSDEEEDSYFGEKTKEDEEEENEDLSGEEDEENRIDFSYSLSVGLLDPVDDNDFDDDDFLDDDDFDD